MSATSGALLARIDAERYVRLLEERLSEVGVDVDALRSPLGVHRRFEQPNSARTQVGASQSNHTDANAGTRSNHQNKKRHDERSVSVTENSVESLVNDYFSIADIAIWSFMCWLTGGNIASVPKDIAKNYDYILRLCKKIDNKDIIQKWVNKTFPKKYSRNFY